MCEFAGWEWALIGLFSPIWIPMALMVAMIILGLVAIVIGAPFVVVDWLHDEAQRRRKPT